MKVRFFDPGKGYRKIKWEIDAAIDRVLTAGDLILRSDVEKFEENLAKFVGTKYAVALNSGTDAIYLALKALNIKGGVALPSHTFKSTCGAVINAGLKPIIYDLNENGAIGEVKAHIPVHIAGEISKFMDVGVPIIEDACQTFGAVKNPTTSAQCWSFYPAKILGAYGDAGALTTNDEKIADYVREARNHFKKDNRDFGINSRMDNIQAAILNVKFKYIDDILEKRERIALSYHLSRLHDIEDLTLPKMSDGRVWQDYIIRLKDTKTRDSLYDYLKANQIETMKNEYPFSTDYPKLPLAAKYEAETLRLPCNPDLEDEEVKCVIEKINEFFS